jgi:hypothetical protein
MLPMRKSYLLLFLLFGSIYYGYSQGRAPGLKWQKMLGGTGPEGLGLKGPLIDRDGQYILAGTSSSGDGDVTGVHPPSPGQPGLSKDIWL